MNPFTKKFIEEHIDLIEEEDWKNLFYNCMVDGKASISELFSALHEAHITGFDMSNYDDVRLILYNMDRELFRRLSINTALIAELSGVDDFILINSVGDKILGLTQYFIPQKAWDVFPYSGQPEDLLMTLPQISLDELIDRWKKYGDLNENSDLKASDFKEVI